MARDGLLGDHVEFDTADARGRAGEIAVGPSLHVIIAEWRQLVEAAIEGQGQSPAWIGAARQDIRYGEPTRLAGDWPVDIRGDWVDAIDGKRFAASAVPLAPYQVLWLRAVAA